MGQNSNLGCVFLEVVEIIFRTSVNRYHWWSLEQNPD